MIDIAEKNRLLGLYENRRPFHGEMHDHSASGGTSDGKCPFAEWPEKMKALKMDFAAILDHRQVRHMYLPEWEDGLFIPGTEPGTAISDSTAPNAHMHYNILLPDRDLLEGLLNEFPEYEFTGGVEGHFIYPEFTRERFGQLIDAVMARGGFFVHPHPKQVMISDNPLDYWFRDETGIEVFYMDMDSEHTKANYPLWLSLLAAGKRIFACAGGDKHAQPGVGALTTIYSEALASASILPHLRAGDFTCGPVGIRMCVGDTKTGGQCAFEGKKLTVCVSDFHESVKFENHSYRLDILTDEGVICSAPVSCREENFVSIDAPDCAFLRAEVFDETRGLRIAVGNPIWNR